METAYQFLLNELQLQYGDTVIVGVSGGPDSMALLHLFIRLKKAFDLEVVCAHVNHNVRHESAEELIFVERFCHQNSIVFESMKIEEYGDDNFHNEARSIRYCYFKTLVEKYHAKYLFTAHHADDLIETILMRVVRGSTMRGYSGFSKMVEMNGYRLVRPLIEVTKEEIFDYLKQYNISYVTDSSNSKDQYTRNRYRKYIVPVLKKEDPNVHRKFYKFSNTLLEYNAFVDREMKKILPQVCPQSIINIETFQKIDPVLQMKVIYYLLEHYYQDDLMLITDHHAELIQDLIINGKTNGEIYLPNHVRAIKTQGTFFLEIRKNEKEHYEIEIIDYINLPNGKNIEVCLESDETDNFICRLSRNDIVFPLSVRTRKDGDAMTVKGMLGHKKVNDIFTDCKISLKERELWPIVVDSTDTIVWLPGLKKTKFDKQKEEKYDIILKYY